MVLHLETGRVRRVPTASYLPLLLLGGLLLAVPLSAQAVPGGAGVAHSAGAATELPGASPAPEPSTWMLMGSGVLALAFLYRRRRAARTNVT